MSKAFFGTDGIRGRAGVGALTPDVLTSIARAAGQIIQNRTKNAKTQPHTVVIGRDTRQSGPEIEQALITGFTQAGVNVLSLGVLPTPAVAMNTQRLKADLGVMITASHNPYHDNGVKFFGPDGCKLGDDDEAAIEALVSLSLEKGEAEAFSSIQTLGSVSQEESSRAFYVNSLISTLPNSVSLKEMNIVLDCAHGAAFETGPEILRALGVKSLTVIGNAPNGVNINKACGSTHTELLSETVSRVGADIGVALDGDADRLIMVDETGSSVDGDQLLGLMGIAGRDNGSLKGGCVVATVMSNLGLERYLEAEGLRLERTAVGDRHVAERMREKNCNIGGEQSGHLLMTDYAPTGDGTLAAIHVLARLVSEKIQGRLASQALRVFKPVPQKLVNVRYEGESPMNKPHIIAAIEAANLKMGKGGRILVRASGTEPLIRVMAEGDDSGLVDEITYELARFIESDSKG